MDVDSVEDLMEDVKVKTWTVFDTAERMLSVGIRCMAIPVKYSALRPVLPWMFSLGSKGHLEIEEPALIESCKKRIGQGLRQTTVKMAFVLPREELEGEFLGAISQEMADAMNREYAGVAEGTSPVDGYWVIPIAGFMRRPRPSDYDMVTSGLGSFPLAV